MFRPKVVVRILVAAGLLIKPMAVIGSTNVLVYPNLIPVIFITPMAIPLMIVIQSVVAITLAAVGLLILQIENTNVV